AHPPWHESRNSHAWHASGSVRANSNGADFRISRPAKIKSARGSPEPGQYTQGCEVARGVTRTVLKPHPPATGARPDIALTNGSSIAITSVFSSSCRTACQYSSYVSS